MPKLKYKHLLSSMMQLYQSGRNCTQIGKTVGVDGDTVKRYLVASGGIKPVTLVSRTDSRKMADAIKPEDIAQLKATLQPGDIIQYKTTGYDDKLNQAEVIRPVYPSYVDILRNRRYCHGK